MAQNSPSKKPEDQKAEIDLLTEENANLKKKLEDSEKLCASQAKLVADAAKTINELRNAAPSGETRVGQGLASSAEIRQLTAILIGPVGLAPDHTPWSGNTWDAVKHGILQTASDMAAMIMAKIPN